MLNQKSPKHYEDLLKNSNSLKEEDLENSLAEVSSILLGLEKGLKILEQMGRKPDPKVLDNQKRFNEIKRKILSLIK
jgi:hypothetical protein